MNSDKEYPIDHDSLREDTWPWEDLDPDNIQLVEQEFSEESLTNDLAKLILKYQISKNAILRQ